MFSEFFAKDLNSCVVSYPIDGEKSEALIEELKNLAGAKYKNDLTCLNSFNPY